MAALALLQLAGLTAEPRYRAQAEAILRQMPVAAGQHPTGFASWLLATETALLPARQLAVIGQPDAPVLQRLTAAAWRRFEPQLVLAAGEGARPALLKGRSMLDGAPTAYLCTDFSCQLPTTDPLELIRQLDAGIQAA